MKTLLRRAAIGLLVALACAPWAMAQNKPVLASGGVVPLHASAYTDTSGNAQTVDETHGLPVWCILGCGGGGGGGGDASAANQVITNNRIGDLVASPAQYSLADRLKTINASMVASLGVPSDAAYAGAGDTTIIAALKGIYSRENALLGYYKSEDAVHVSGDNGMLGLAVRQATTYATPTSGTAGDYEGVKTDPDGNVFVARSDGKPITVTPLTAPGVLFSIDTLGWDSVAYQLTGTWVGSVVFEVSNDNVTWYAANVYTPLGGASSSTTNVNSAYSYVAQHRYFRARASVLSSGTLNGVALLRTGPPAGYSNAGGDALLTSILAKIIAAPATEATLAAVLAKQKGPLIFTQTAGSPFTLTSSWTKVATTTAATKGLIVAPSANASAFDIEWTSVTAGAAAPSDLYGVPVGYGETFADGLPIGDVYLKSATGMVATVRTGS